MTNIKYFIRCNLFIVIYGIRYTFAYNFHRLTGWTSHGTLMTSFSTQWNVPLHRCVDECILRAQCRAVLYTRSQRRCNMLDTYYMQARATTGISLTITSRVFIKKTDMLITDEMYQACQNCISGTVCDEIRPSCNFEECPSLEVPNAVVNGNRVTIGAVVRIVPKAGYMLNSGGSYPTCEEDGTWGNVPTTSLLDCGVPQTVLNAVITEGNTLYGSIRTYVCKDGYDVIESTVNMTITCTVHSSWSAVLFECLEKTCQEGWFMIGNSCYKFETTPQTRASALAYCSSFNAHLVTMETEAENSALEAHLINNYNSVDGWWVGIDDEAVEGTWVYTHTHTRVTFTDWDQGEPSNSDATENCVEIRYGNTVWNDLPCDYPRNVICEKM